MAAKQTRETSLDDLRHDSDSGSKHIDIIPTRLALLFLNKDIVQGYQRDLIVRN